MRRKKNSYKGLAELDVLITDTKHDSQYFKVSNFPDQITSGKNYFNIKGNAKLLEPGSVIEVEVMPENGTEPIFHEVHRYLDDALRRVVTIYGYPEYMTGLATVTIVGVAKYRGGGRLVSPNWRGRRNVRWQGNTYIDPLKTNVTDIIFLRQPRITINENVKSHLSESFIEGPGGDRTMSYASSPGAQDTSSWFSKAELTFNEVWSTAGRFGNMPIYEFIASEPLFSSSMLHGTLEFEKVSLKLPWTTDDAGALSQTYSGIIPPPPVGQSGMAYVAFADHELPQFRMDGSNNRQFALDNDIYDADFTTSIIEVVNSTKVRVSAKWGMDYVISESAGLGPNPQRSGYDPPLVSVQKAYDPTSWTTQAGWKLSYQGPPETRIQDSYNYHSYANLIIANLDPIAGDVHSIKIWMKSHGVGAWDLLADSNVESAEMFDDESDVYSYKRKGVFRSQSICDDYWTGSYWIPSASWDLNYAGLGDGGPLSGFWIDMIMTPITKSDSEALMNGMIISGSEKMRWAQQSFGNQAYGQESIDYRNESFMFVMPKEGIQVYQGCEYSITFKAAAHRAYDSGSYNTENSNTYGWGYCEKAEMQLYVSGTAIANETVTNAKQHILKGKSAPNYRYPNWEDNVTNFDWRESWGRRLDEDGDLVLNLNSNDIVGTPEQEMVSATQLTNVGEVAAMNPRANSITAYPQAMEQMHNSTPDFHANAINYFDDSIIQYSFIADKDGDFVPIFAVKYGKWSISEVSIKSTTQTGFTPNHTILEGRVPEYQQDDILDFKFEFYNPIGKRAELVFVTNSISFQGGNTYISAEGLIGEGIILDGGITMGDHETGEAF